MEVFLVTVTILDTNGKSVDSLHFTPKKSIQLTCKTEESGNINIVWWVIYLFIFLYIRMNKKKDLSKFIYSTWCIINYS